MKLCALLAVLIFGGTCTSLVADQNDQTLLFGTDYWPGYVNQDGSGPVLELLRAAYVPAGYKVKIQLSPFKRLSSLLSNGTIDAIVGTYSSNYTKGLFNFNLLTPNHPIAKETLIAICVSNIQGSWQDTSYAWTRGYHYEELLGLPKRTLVNSADLGLKMLARGRLPCLLDSDQTITALADRLGIPLNQFHKEFVADSYLYLSFLINERNKNLAQTYDQAVKSLHQQATFEDQFGQIAQDIKDFLSSAQHQKLQLSN
ncbi:hypothetical protein HBA55_01720 [Pseudomaricurvus alkylphenolicus]|jgi:polar amino acid transport system substrate-binding protein|uniref:transporter substrate-binding domain-containing protein n=1 Tax=Pseudomaricurvus alkylphenolicus TaxID=1306991 RepID=UPI00142241AA|nr:transporter substrate-binding domain-containing protein [Pseudomaricurvus alkylphenolicus]NIB38281.1 hypothetical protein [Pseudomaricurvus alkylphenolicus]